MSVRMMTIVWGLDLPDSDKLVLLALADSANDEGHCWPSVASLVRKCSKSDRTIQASIKRLVDAHHLTRREVPGKGCNYTVHPRRDCTPETVSPPKGTTQTPEAASDKPLRTTNSEAKASETRVIETWNGGAKEAGFISSKVQDASLRQKIRLRVKEHGLEMVLDTIRAAFKAGWLRGEGRDTKWRPSLDWILTPANFRKVAEGSYGEAETTPSVADQRAAQLRTAALYDRLGRDAEAAEIRRRWEGEGDARPLASVAQNFLEGARPQ